MVTPLSGLDPGGSSPWSDDWQLDHAPPRETRATFLVSYTSALADNQRSTETSLAVAGMGLF
jgi:hypothetical protein